MPSLYESAWHSVLLLNETVRNLIATSRMCTPRNEVRDKREGASVSANAMDTCEPPAETLTTTHKARFVRSSWALRTDPRVQEEPVGSVVLLTMRSANWYSSSAAHDCVKRMHLHSQSNPSMDMLASGIVPIVRHIAWRTGKPLLQRSMAPKTYVA